ncbi:hypothetical protein SO802_019862 [Lithocarpus litseifolius]|uniref:RRM domain-containing protein n=1 Tax=Lithocarpus litseifolius TaxID=425828 RepID=A0AAW2CST6_9ROSI
MVKYDGSESSRKGERKRQEKESETESESEAEMVKYDGNESSRKGKRKRQEKESETESEKRRMKKKMKKREKEKRRKKQDTESESEAESEKKRMKKKMKKREKEKRRKKQGTESESEAESEKRRMKKKMRKRGNEKRRKKQEKVSGSETESVSETENAKRHRMKKIRKREKEKSRKKQEEEGESEKESEGKKMKEDPDDGRHRGMRTEKVGRVEPEPVPPPLEPEPDDGRHRGRRTEKVGRVEPEPVLPPVEPKPVPPPVEPEPVPEGYFVPSALSTEMRDDLERRGTTCVFIQTSLRVRLRDVYRFFEPELSVRQARLVYSENGRYTGVGFVEFYDLGHVRNALDYSGNLLCHYPVLVRYVEVDDYLDEGPMPEVLVDPAVLDGPHEEGPEAERYRNMSRVVEDSRHPKFEPTQCMVLENMFDKTLRSSCYGLFVGYKMFPYIPIRGVQAKSCWVYQGLFTPSASYSHLPKAFLVVRSQMTSALEWSRWVRINLVSFECVNVGFARVSPSLLGEAWLTSLLDHRLYLMKMKRETSARSPDVEVGSYDGEESEEEVVDEDGDEGDGGGEESEADEGKVDERTSEGGSTGSPGDGHTRPFILPIIFIVNDFKPTMTSKVFNSLRDRYQIPDHIPLCLPRKFEKCYSGRVVDVGMYDAMFAAGLRLPLAALHRQLANFLGLFVSQIAPNAWRIFIGTEILWGSLSGGNPSVRPLISGNQEAFIHRVTEIPLDERKCWDLITLDTLHAYYGGPKSMPAARRLNEYSHHRKDDCPSKKPLVAPGEQQPKKPSLPKSGHGSGKGLMTSSSPGAKGIRRLLTDEVYAIKMLGSIIKETDVDPCAKQEREDLGSSGLFDLAWYKEALRTLNKEVKELTKKLKEEGAKKEEEQQAKEAVKKELTALHGQVERAKADVIIELKASQSFVDAYAVFYGDGLEDCLKLVKFVHSHLDLSKVSIDDPLPSTPAGDTVYEEDDDFTKSNLDPKNDGVVLTQPAVEKVDTPLIPSTEALDAKNPSIQDAQDPHSKNDENPPA